MSETHQQNNFDFIRFAAAAMVWYYHCYAFTGGNDPLTRIIPYESFGGLGVSIFFIVSGYFITASYHHHGRVVPFLRNRILRIMPALIMVVVLSTFVLGPLVTTLSFTAYFHDAQTWRYLKNLLVFPLQYELPGVFQDHAIHAVNGSLWTLQHELRCYLVIALLGVLGILQPRLMTVIFFACLGVLVYSILFKGTPPIMSAHSWDKLRAATHLGFLFAGGAVIYMFRSHVPRHFGFLTACFLLFVVASQLPPAWGTLLFDLALMYSVIYLGFLRVPLVPHFGRFGDFSYGFYLYAFPMQQLTLHVLHVRDNFFAFVLASFAATLLCAVASWHLVEKPALRHKA